MIGHQTKGRSVSSTTRFIAVAFALVVAAGVSSAASCSSTPQESTSPSPQASTSAATDLVIACATGPKSATLSLVSMTGEKTDLVTSDGAEIDEIAVSPSGAYIAYNERFRDMNADWDYGSRLMIYNVASGKTAAYFTSPFMSQVPEGNIMAWAVGDRAWVSDSEMIVVAYTYRPLDPFSNGDLVLCNVDTDKCEPLSGSSGDLTGTAPSVSADGSRLAFVTYGPAGSEEVDDTLNLYDFKDKSIRTVAAKRRGTPEAYEQFANPLLSPDGTMIFTEQTGSDVGFQITVYNVDGTKRFSSDTLLAANDAAWGPSGSGLIAFTGSADVDTPKSGIQFYDAKANHIEDPTWTLGHANALAWSPDGKWLAYTEPGGNNDLGDDLHLVNADRTSDTVLLTGASSPSFGVITAQ